jgi:hypothetical protein
VAVRILVLGASGSAGGSVLRVCLSSPAIGEVRALARRRLGLAQPRLREIRHADFGDFTGAADAFTGIDACFYCLGKSVRQVSGEAEYRRITYDFALAAARTLREHSPGAAFHFISGQGANLASRFMWARVKAQTERDLLAGYDALCYRPASIDGVPSASEPPLYKVFRPIARLLLRRFRGLYVTGEDLGLAMVRATVEGLRGRILENAEIRDLADAARSGAGSGG